MFVFKYNPDYNKNTEEIELFFEKLTDRKAIPGQWKTLWISINQIAARGSLLERKWRGQKKQMGKLPLGMMRRDINRLAFDVGVNIAPFRNVIEYGIESSQRLLDELPSRLSYLKDTRYVDYISELTNLLYSLEDLTKRTDVRRILREYGEHRDLITTCQFYSNEMVENYRYLSQDFQNRLLDREEIIRYLDIYQKLCALFDRDMCLTYCLLELRDKGDRNSYTELRRNQREPIDKINHVGKVSPLLVEPYDRILRNAEAHNDVETDKLAQRASIPKGDNTKPYAYLTIIRKTREMSALVSAFRLIAVILGHVDWQLIKSILHYEENS